MLTPRAVDSDHLSTTVSAEPHSAKSAPSEQGHRWLLASAILLGLAILSAGGAWWYRQTLDRSLCEAAFYGNASAVTRLLRSGARAENRDSRSGLSALAVAADRGNTEVVRILLAHGADVNARGPEGDTALKQAAFWGRTECARLLIAHGADVNDVDPAGTAALIMAVSNGHSETVRLLLEGGADVGVSDVMGRSLVYRAKLSLRSLSSRRAALTETIRMLREYGAKD